MKLIGEYLEHARSFERLAAEENDRKLKVQFEQQGQAYRKLAAARAARYGVSPASAPQRNQTGI